jgi:hypothetical protein
MQQGIIDALPVLSSVSDGDGISAYRGDGVRRVRNVQLRHALLAVARVQTIHRGHLGFSCRLTGRLLALLHPLVHCRWQLLRSHTTHTPPTVSRFTTTCAQRVRATQRRRGRATQATLYCRHVISGCHSAERVTWISRMPYASSMARDGKTRQLPYSLLSWAMLY